MRIAGLIRDSLVNGTGLRDVLFIQGCPHHCEGCQNPHTWNPDGGIELTVDEIINELKNSSNNITLSGGEPFWNTYNLINLTKQLSIQFPTKTIWVYTGYRFEELSRDVLEELLYNNVMVIVDGQYEKDKRDVTLQFRGSSNQRIIDIKKSLLRGEVVLWEDANG